jgi:hypothetical protein
MTTDILTTLVEAALKSGLMRETTREEIQQLADVAMKEGDYHICYCFYWSDAWYEEVTYILNNEAHIVDSAHGMPLEGRDAYGREDSRFLAERYAILLEEGTIVPTES